MLLHKKIEIKNLFFNKGCDMEKWSPVLPRAPHAGTSERCATYHVFLLEIGGPGCLQVLCV